MQKPIVCVTEKEYYKAEEVFCNSRQFEFIPTNLSEDVLEETIKKNKAFGAILGVDPFVDGLYKALPKGGIIARFGVGHEGVDKNKAIENNLIVTNTPGVLDDSVAEHAIGLIYSLARQSAFHDNNMKMKKWEPCSGMELKGKTLLLIGCGAIGCKVAKIASFGFGMNVIGFDVATRDAEKMKTEFGISEMIASLDDAVPNADFISIHIPSIPVTKHFVNKIFLSKMNQNAYLINTARGPVVKEIDLYDALEKKQIAGAALDVFENEPFQPVEPNKDLRTLKNVILTPHVGSSTQEACRRMAHSCVKNIKAAYEKRYNEVDMVNPQVLEKLK